MCSSFLSVVRTGCRTWCDMWGRTAQALPKDAQVIGQIRRTKNLFESPCCHTIQQSALVYVIVACSEKEPPHSFTHSKKVHLNCLQISPCSAQYNGQKGARQPRLTSPNAPLTCVQFTHVVGALTRMRRAPRQHVLVVGETAPTFPAMIPLRSCPIMDHDSNLRPLAVIHASPNVECAT